MSHYFIAATGYFWLLLVTSGYFSFRYFLVTTKFHRYKNPTKWIYFSIEDDELFKKTMMFGMISAIA